MYFITSTCISAGSLWKLTFFLRLPLALFPDAGVSAYPVKLCAMHIVTKKPVRVTVAYVPHIWAKFETMSASKAATVRSKILQSTLALAFRDLIVASHFGAEMNLPDGSSVLVTTRVILYISNQPEERDVLCLKGHGSACDCTPCMEASEFY